MGDFCITKQLISHLRSALPQAELHLVANPAKDWEGKRTIQRMVDMYREVPFAHDITDTFDTYSAVINAPGGGLQTQGDTRGNAMLRDAAACATKGVPHVFASHSIHPSFDVRRMRSSLCIMREPSSIEYLQGHGITVTYAADLAFLEQVPRPTTRTEETLIFLRFDHIQHIAREGHTLILDDRRINLPRGPLAFSTSDHRKDGPLLSALSTHWNIPYRPAESLEHLIELIGTAKRIISDRYHPIIFGEMSGTPWTFIQRKGSLRDRGLRQLLGEKNLQHHAHTAQQGLHTLVTHIQQSA